MSRRSGPINTEVSILSVEDNAVATKLMNRILADVGHVRFATNGPAALRLAQESPPDLILLDANMAASAEFSGIEATDLLRAADEALYCAKQAGRARHHFRDIGDVTLPSRGDRRSAGCPEPDMVLVGTRKMHRGTS